MIVFGSRGSDLALTQTRQVAQRLLAATGEQYRIAVIETTGDRVLERPLDAIGVKGAFTVELAEALRAGRIDAAVHSLKDLPVEAPPDLTIAAIPERADPSDVVVATATAIADGEAGLPLRPGVRVGSSSPRRRYAVKHHRDDLDLRDVRGNVPTRVQKVARGDYDAVLLAAAGLDRLALDLGALQRRALPTAAFPPAPGQGALAVECRSDDARVRNLLSQLHDESAARCVQAERALLQGLGGGCSLPLGALVQPVGAAFRLQAALFCDSGAGLWCDRTTHDLDGLVQELAALWAPLLSRPLRGLRVALPRPDGRGGALAEALTFAGADVEALAWTRTEPVAADESRVHALCKAAALAFGSPRAVERWFAVAGARAGDGPRTTFAVGDGTAAALRSHGVEPGVSDGSGGEAMAAMVCQALAPGRVVGYPCAADRHDGFERAMQAAGREVLPLPLYRTSAVARPPAPAATPHVVLLTAPSLAAVFAASADLRDVPCAAIGETTAAALRAAGIQPAVTAGRATPTAVALCLMELHHERPSTSPA
ncbi:MAG TPA: hydroxymethylbilane synthase [Planctomycetota bacterium]|nr:hydroxymethylbilane synthase [Planctomycetota bacterium]